MNTAGSKLVRLTVERTNTLAAVAHDLRTYLTRLRMRSELIEDDTQKAKSIRDIEEMTQLIEDTLSLGESVAKPSQSERLNLAAWLEGFVAHRVDGGDPIKTECEPGKRRSSISHQQPCRARSTI